MNEKRRVMHWDKRKRKYVQMTVGELKRGEKGERGGKKQRLENGQKVKELKAGQLYKKWQEKNHRKIAREGLDEVLLRLTAILALKSRLSSFTLSLPMSCFSSSFSLCPISCSHLA